MAATASDAPPKGLDSRAASVTAVKGREGGLRRRSREPPYQSPSAQRVDGFGVDFGVEVDGGGEKDRNGMGEEGDGDAVTDQISRRRYDMRIDDARGYRSSEELRAVDERKGNSEAISRIWPSALAAIKCWSLLPVRWKQANRTIKQQARQKWMAERKQPDCSVKVTKSEKFPSQLRLRPPGHSGTRSCTRAILVGKQRCITVGHLGRPGSLQGFSAPCQAAQPLATGMVP